MLRRYLPLLLVVTAVALCAAFLVHVLDGESPEDAVEPVESAVRAPKPLVTLEAEPSRETELVAADTTPPRSAPETDATTEARPSTGIDEANEALNLLAKLLMSSRSVNGEIVDALARVQEYYLRPPAPPGLVRHAPPTGGPSAEGRIVSEANLRQFAVEQAWPAGYLKQVQRFRKGAEKQFLNALKLYKRDRETETNAREPVNIEAAKVLGGIGNPALSKGVIRTLERSILKAKYEVSAELYDAAFGAVGHLGNPEGLEWFQEEFGNTKSAPPRVVDQVVAAHKAMLLFDPEKTSGKLRHAVVKQFVRVYAGVEALSGQPEHAAYWKRVGPGVVRVLQRFAGRPKFSDGRRIDTLAGFTAWLREHTDPRGPPWGDD